MSVNLDALRERLKRLNGEYKSNSSVSWFKTALGEQRVRFLPWKDAKDGLPFLELSFYNIGGKSILAPIQFGKPDPINDLIQKLWKGRQDDDIAIAKKLRAKRQSYGALIDRANEDKGPQVWSLKLDIEQALTAYFFDEDVGDILDVETGFDIKLVTTKDPSGKMWQGKPVLKTTVEASRRGASKLSNDPEKVKQWLEAVPKMTDYFKLMSTEEIESTVQNWLDSDEPEQVKEQARRYKEEAAAKKKDEQPAATPAPAPKKAAVAAAPSKKAVEQAPPEIDLDAAMADLMSDD